MKPTRLAEIRRAVGGFDPSSSTADVQISAISSDTRTLRHGALFIALRGDNFDGHDFLAKAADAGAAAAIVDRPPRDAPPGLRLLQVPDARAAMGKLARHMRHLFGGKVIAVAGSNGKTGTKNLIHSVLRKTLRGSISPKSFNNDIGVPLAIFPADPTDDYLVLELGTNHQGEIRTLANIAMPDIAVITNCSAEHLEGLGSLDGVRNENASIAESLKPKGTLIVNGDDPALLRALANFDGRRIRFGCAASNEIRASKIRCEWSGTHFTVDPGGVPTFVPLLGGHTAVNALAAITVARIMGLSDEQIVDSLATATGPEMRLQLVDAEGVRIINDAYNANPASMKAAIQTLAALPATGRRIAVLGDMRELGEASAASHGEIGRFFAEKYPADLLFCIGADSRAIAAEAVKLGYAVAKIEHFADAAAAAGAIAARVSLGDVVLLKASRAIGLEAAARAIVAARSKPLAAAS
jgi:UDP-N-acetylmuramoyl-tripeptide--D-alanyl-D-alanine ligase